MSASIRQPANDGVVRYLDRPPETRPDLRPPRDDRGDYMYAGSHPDVVERVWDQLGRELPPNARAVVLGTPALVQPDTLVVLVLAIGTQYALRLPAFAWEPGVPINMTTTVTWAGGRVTDVRETLGRDWVFGRWDRREDTWCRAAYAEWGQ
jgi:hypothetical protein